ncbi:unnamed protein product [Hermetia illucens]|uniref:CULT domain-containing protein n=1 Tax=Hermetia illucens TaxID=343691 RepID=A0A7R8Z117_HERIL|nr:uncharacterized protein LOC119659901 [Hermetia illucens]CAD7092136.1 unnamed protein product [Hermetia illucens]
MKFRIMTGSGRLAILLFLSVLFSFKFCATETSTETETEKDVDQGETILEDYLVCRTCGADAALSNFVISQLSPKALVAANETLFGKEVLVQILENPLGLRYEVVTSRRATCKRIGVWTKSHTWFPGYAWKLCLCSRCSAHLGWMFEPIATATDDQFFPTEKGFYVIVLSNIIPEKEVKSLLASAYTPTAPGTD